jgi:hypothetical protein
MYVPKPLQGQELAADIIDWDRAAGGLAQTMEDRGYFDQQPGRPSPPTFYIYNTAPKSTFLSEVSHALEEEMINRGVVIVRSPKGAITLNLDVDLIHWTGDFGYGTVAEASWGATILGQGSVDFRFRDSFYIRSGDAPLYATAMTLPPIGPDVRTVYSPLRQTRLVGE